MSALMSENILHPAYDVSLALRRLAPHNRSGSSRNLGSIRADGNDLQAWGGSAAATRRWQPPNFQPIKVARVRHRRAQQRALMWHQRCKDQRRQTGGDAAIKPCRA